MDIINLERAALNVYNNKIENVDSIRSDIIGRSLVSSIKETFNQTPVGKKIKNLEENIARYFIAEYSKIDSEDKAHFYLPGKLSAEQMKKKKEYKISLSSSLYPGANSLKKDFSLGLKGNFRDTKINTFYDVYKKGFGFNLKTGKLKSCLGIKLCFDSEYYKDEKGIGLSVSIDF